MIVLYYNKNIVEFFYKSVKEDFWAFHIAGFNLEKQILDRFLKINVLILCHFTASMICLLLLIRFPLVDMPEGVRPLPNIIWTPFDTNPSPVHEIVYLIMVWNLSLSVLGNAFYDMLYVYSLQHLFVQFSLLKELLRNITNQIMEERSDTEKFQSSLFQRMVKERLNICVEHHSTLLRYRAKHFIITDRDQDFYKYYISIIKDFF